MLSMKILICGFMGCGKSTLLQKVKESNPSLECLDLDEEILRIYNEASSQILIELGLVIRLIGWEKFRALEYQGLESVLKRDNVLVALGGGTLTQQGLDLAKKEKAILVWLNTDFDTCYQRVRSDKNRPLSVKTKEELREIYNSREALYSQADYQITQLPNDMKEWISSLI